MSRPLKSHLLTALLLGLAACSGQGVSPADEPPEATAEASEATVVPQEPGPEYDFPLGPELFRVAARLAPGMEADGEPLRGHLDEGQGDQHQAVLNGALCYKIVAIGGEGISDLDLTLFDQNNVPILRDRGTDRTPVLGLSQPICPLSASIHRIEVRSHAGAGDYALRIFKAISL